MGNKHANPIHLKSLNTSMFFF